MRFSADSAYMIDDGTAEDAVGFGNGAQNFEALWFNQFAVIPGLTALYAVHIAWGSPNVLDAIDGTPVTIGIWSDPNGDGNPSDAALLGQVSGTIQNANTNTFVTYYLFPEIYLSPDATSFFVGDMTPMNFGPEHYYQGLDNNIPLHRQSWVAGMGSGAPVDFNNPGNNDIIGLIDDFGVPANWLIRVDAFPVPPALLGAQSVKHGFAVDLPLTGPSGVEDRSDGSNGTYTVVMTFDKDIASLEGLSSTCGFIQSVSVDSSDPHKVNINLAEVTRSCNESTITVTVVVFAVGGGYLLASAQMGLLLGDVNGDRAVDFLDGEEVQSEQGQRTDSTNFRSDVNIDGHVGRADLKLIRRAQGTSLP